MAYDVGNGMHDVKMPDQPVDTMLTSHKNGNTVGADAVSADKNALLLVTSGPSEGPEPLGEAAASAVAPSPDAPTAPPAPAALPTTSERVNSYYNYITINIIQWKAS